MSDIYQITLTTQTGETFTGKMSRRQPELVNGFVPLATETGEGCISLLPTLSVCISRQYRQNRQILKTLLTKYLIESALRLIKCH